MKYEKFFEVAKKEGVETLELYIKKESSLSFEVFHDELSSYTTSDSFSILARGTYQGKMGYVYCEKLDKTTPAFVIDQIKQTAKIIDKDAPNIFKGSEKYQRGSVYNPELSKISAKDKIAKVMAIEKGIKAKDSRITESSTSYSEETSETIIMNSYGLKLKNKTNYFFIFADGVGVDEKKETKTAYVGKLSNNFNEVDVQKVVDEVVEKVVSKFGGEPCASAKYKTVLNQEVTARLLSHYLSNLKADAIQKNTSLLKDKLEQKVVSNKISVIENPTEKNIFFTPFDDEGVATYKKDIIKKGVLKTYFYNIESAEKDNVKSTGNGYYAGEKIGISYSNIVLKPGKKSEEELFKLVEEGIYITDVQGLHSGMNAKSGNFSLQASGFAIRNGVKAEPISLITIAGNLFELFNDIKEVASNSELQSFGFTAPSIYVKKLSVSGK